jgi:hypothetical protein
VNKNVDDKENGNRKRSTKGKKRYQNKWDGQGAKREKKKGRATGGIITEVKLGKGEEE